ncbi:putative penicillin-binding protein [Kitasatospora setae KM-6054]|uniref:Putative penicillin-binding protein n=1 Tax=Kitasatospora setae (strain ATCC 33774 / DSM 43861 / JCM 3304 / KCC A-0304 / NBRC 14216 / KM-6054) TaxID=452652 RepID=E4N0S0_KITSK|nr:putative penicillin-binding protein [Kitasatospora setae KM-6054]
MPGQPGNGDEAAAGPPERTARADARTARAGRRRLLPRRPRRPRRLDYPRAGRSGVRRWLPSWRQLLLLAGTCCALLCGTVGVLYATTEVPTDLNAFATQQNNVFYWADGTEMARTGLVNRQDVPLDQVPEQVRWAVLAAENETFYSDPGISFQGIGRALYRMGSGGDTQGGSTITQQYVKNAYLNQRQDFSRKLDEMFIALKLDQRDSKEQILSGYLNISWFGRGSYGIERAAQAYYGKHVSELNVSEGAFLAAVLKGASLYDPALNADNHARAVDRWSWILDRMVKIGRLSAADRAKYTDFPEPNPVPPLVGLNGQTGYLVDLAKSYAQSHADITPAQFDLGGYQIHTTFEKPKEQALTEAVQSAAKKLDPERRPADQNVHIGAASVAADGRILAVYGGPDYLKQGFNNANTVNVPAGSAFTPLVYAAGLAQGVQRERNGPRTPVQPTTTYNGDNGVDLRTPEGPYWGRDGKKAKTTNDGGRNWGTLTLRAAVERSVNGPLQQLGMDVGLDNVRRTALALGLLPESMGDLTPAYTLGNSTPSAIRLADAYTAFDADGKRTDPYSVTSVTRNGSQIAVDKPATVQALTSQVAAEVDTALRGAARDGLGLAKDGTGTAKDATGTAKEAKEAAADSGAKAGSTQEHDASWFVGYHGGVSTAVTVFRLDLKTLELLPLTGIGGTAQSAPDAAIPAGIWAANARGTAR